MAAVAACGGFGAVCGSSLATASTMGRVALPELKRLNYEPALATGTLAAGGTLGILIPPSVVLIVYAIIVEANIVTLFAAALIPGLIAVLFFIITIAIYVAVRPGAGPIGGAGHRPRAVPRDPRRAAGADHLRRRDRRHLWRALHPDAGRGDRRAARRALRLRPRAGSPGATRSKSILETARTTGMIYLILLGASLLTIFMSRAGVPQATAALLHDSGLSPMTIMVLIIVIYLILGCLMDSLSMIILATPFFWPVVSGLDYGLSPDELKIWYGIITLIVVELGLITPPVGLNVFIINSLVARRADARDVQGRDAVLRERDRARGDPRRLPDHHARPCRAGSRVSQGERQK